MLQEIVVWIFPSDHIGFFPPIARFIFRKRAKINQSLNTALKHSDRLAAEVRSSAQNGAATAFHTP